MPNRWLTITRGLLGLCPKCGSKRLFARYLKQVQHCPACHEHWGAIRADDAPAWLTIVLVGHLLAPVLLVVIPETTWPDWVLMTFWPGVALLLTLVLLPRIKGLFIAILWRMHGCRAEE